MREPRGRPALALDPRPLARVLGGERDALERDGAPVALVARDPDAAVAARADLFEQPVAAEDQRILQRAPGPRPGRGPGARKRLHGRAFVAHEVIPARPVKMMRNLQA